MAVEPKDLEDFKKRAQVLSQQLMYIVRTMPSRKPDDPIIPEYLHEAASILSLLADPDSWSPESESEAKRLDLDSIEAAAKERLKDNTYTWIDPRCVLRLVACARARRTAETEQA